MSPPDLIVYGPSTGSYQKWNHVLSGEDVATGVVNAGVPAAGVVGAFSPPAEDVNGLTPAARWDVVPAQRASSAFKVGIVAFSKGGIYGVGVTPSGQSYSGGELTATAMTYNDRTDVWEYWVSVDPSDFSTSGAISLAGVVYGDDGGRRTLDSLTLYVDRGGLSQPEAWVAAGGSDITGIIGNSSYPYATVSGALNDIQSTYVTCSGAVVYVGEGEWELGDATITTAGEWLSIVAASGAAQANVIFHGGGAVTSTNRIRFYNLTLRSDGTNDKWLQGWPDPAPTWLWVDTCRVVGSGRWTTNSSPVFRHDNWFCTGSSHTNTDITMRFADIVRNTTVEAIGDDCCFLCDLVINVTLHNQDPNINEEDGNPTYDHADAWQWSGAGMDNKIVYGFHATDIHVQGVIARQPDGGTHTNSAFVNCLWEMRYPRRPGDSGDTQTEFDTLAFYGPMDHLMFWHCSVPVGRAFNCFDEPVGYEFTMTNCSFVGNLFKSYLDWDQGDTNPVAYGAPGNAEGNEFLENHYTESYVDGVGSLLYSKSPDTDSSGSQTLGDPDIVTTLDAADYGTPNATSPLLNRLSTKRVPIDVYENERDATPDCGAVERV